MSTTKIMLYGLLGLIAFIVVLFSLQAAGMVSYSFFGKWGEQVRTEIQRESFAYTDGMMKNLSQMANDYALADDNGKQMILAGVRAQYASVDTSEYPAYLKEFLNTAGIY